MQAILKLYNFQATPEDWEPVYEYTLTLPDGSDLRAIEREYNNKFLDTIAGTVVAEYNDEETGGYSISVTPAINNLDHDNDPAAVVFDRLRAELQERDDREKAAEAEDTAKQQALQEEWAKAWNPNGPGLKTIYDAN